MAQTARLGRIAVLHNYAGAMLSTPRTRGGGGAPNTCNAGKLATFDQKFAISRKWYKTNTFSTKDNGS